MTTDIPVHAAISGKADYSMKTSLLSKEIWLDPSQAIDIVLESLRELVEYELAVVLEYASPSRLRVRKAAGPLASSRFRNYEISLDERSDLAGLMQSTAPHLFETGSGYRDTYDGILDLPEGHSCLAAPLSVKGRNVGILTLDHRECGVFTPEIVRFIGVLSRLIALALLQSDASASLLDRNARLLAERNRLIELDTDIYRNLAGSSGPWIRVLDSLRLVAGTEAPVLLTGETGTGKEEAARAIHRLSPRASGPFIALNCSALPSSLAESELFGHEKGSFTGAQGLHRGRFELADGGTLFLDEIGDLPLDIQPKILRTLQEGTIVRVGGESPIPVNIRVIAATHVDLGGAVESGRFRDDLFYRLAVFPIRLPPLREREDDVLILAEHFLTVFRERAGWRNLGFTHGALEAIKSRSWTGNVRELRNAVERAAILAHGGMIGAAEFSDDPGAGCRCCPDSDDPCPAAIPCPLQSQSTDHASLTREVTGFNGMPDHDLADIDSIQREHIVKVLARTGGRLYGAGGAASILGLKPSTLQSRMKKLGIARRDFLKDML